MRQKATPTKSVGPSTKKGPSPPTADEANPYCLSAYSAMNLSRAVVMDGAHRFVPFGQTPPIKLLRCGRAEPQPQSVLCANAVDPRSVLYSLHCRQQASTYASSSFTSSSSDEVPPPSSSSSSSSQPSASPPTTAPPNVPTSFPPVSFTLNSPSLANTARSAVLLHLCTSCAPSSFPLIFEIWFGLFLSDAAAALLASALSSLQSSSLPSSFSIPSPITHASCVTFWRAWSAILSSPPSASKIASLRSSFLFDSLAINDDDHVDDHLRTEYHASLVRHGYVAGSVVAGAAPGKASVVNDDDDADDGKQKQEQEPHPLPPSCHLFREELAAYNGPDVSSKASPIWRNPKSKEDVVNPTMFPSGDAGEYIVAVETAFYDAFPLWAFDPTSISLLKYCEATLSKWLTSLRSDSSLSGVSFVFTSESPTELHNIAGTSLSSSPYTVLDFSDGALFNAVGLPHVLLSSQTLHLSASCTLLTASPASSPDLTFGLSDAEHSLFGWSSASLSSSASFLWPFSSPKSRPVRAWNRVVSTSVSSVAAPVPSAVWALLASFASKAFAATIAASPAPNMSSLANDLPAFLSCSPVLLAPLLHRLGVNADAELPREIVDAIPQHARPEIDAWRRALDSENDGGGTYYVTVSKVGGFCTQFTERPFLRVEAEAKARDGGEEEKEKLIFSCLTIGANTVSFLSSVPVDLRSVSVVEERSGKSFTNTVAVEAPRPALPPPAPFFPAEVVADVDRRISATDHDALSLALLRDIPFGPSPCVAVPFSPRSHPRVVSSCTSVSTRLQTKRDLLSTRIAAAPVKPPPSYLPSPDPVAVLKELLVEFLNTQNEAEVMCVDDGAGGIPMVLAMEKCVLDELSGTPLLEMLIFVPDVAFSANTVPHDLRTFLGEERDLWSSSIAVPLSVRTAFIDFASTLSIVGGNGDGGEEEKVWGVKGRAWRVHLPTPYPSRAAAYAEYLVSLTVAAVNNGELSLHPRSNTEALSSMAGLKKLGNDLLARGAFGAACDVYVIGAALMEEGSVDEGDEAVKEAAAQLHCNLAFALTKLCDEKKMLGDMAGVRACCVEALRSSTHALKLKPTYEKALWRRATVYEKIAALNPEWTRGSELSLSDLTAAVKLCPSSKEIRTAWERAAKEKKKEK